MHQDHVIQKFVLPKRFTRPPRLYVPIEEFRVFLLGDERWCICDLIHGMTSLKAETLEETLVGQIAL